MKTLLVQFFAVFASISMYFLLPVDPALASVCTLEDEEYANFWDNYYDPEDAYNFGLKIQNFRLEECRILLEESSKQRQKWKQPMPLCL